VKPTNYGDDLVDGFVGSHAFARSSVVVIRAVGAASPRHWRRATDSDPNGVDTVEFGFLAADGATRGKERTGGVSTGYDVDSKTAGVVPALQPAVA
jgi:hypothetical protein